MLKPQTTEIKFLNFSGYLLQCMNNLASFNVNNLNLVNARTE